MANVLNVYFNAELAGTLRDEKGRLYFQHAPAWLRSPNLVALCCGRANIDHLCRLNFDQGLLLT